MSGDGVTAQAQPTRLLIVFSPGLGGQMDRWRTLGGSLAESTIFDGYSGIDWQVFDHGLRGWSFGWLDHAARQLEALIAGHWRRDVHKDIILVGHSVGGAIIRQAWLNAIDPGQGANYMNSRWGQHVRRIVLFAGLSRGADAESSALRRAIARVIAAVPGHLILEDCVRGSIFLTNLRISWIRQMARLGPGHQPVVAQILGTSDAFVDDADSLDITTFPNALRRRIPGAGHGDLHHLDADRETRLHIIGEALTEAPDEDDRVHSHAAERNVLMVVHGIRASNSDDWVRRAQVRAMTLQPDLHVAAPSYGYVSALRFAFPSTRKRYSRRFRDFYTEQLAKRPLADFSVLCHSNGTYLLGQSLVEFGAIKVNRIALAASVLPRSFPWRSLIERGQVGKVRSDGGSLDVPVGLLCSGLRSIGMRDIGTGGFAGFLDAEVNDVRYHPGGHDSMLADGNVDSMLKFLLEDADLPLLSAGRSPLDFPSRLVGVVTPLLLLAIAAVWLFALYSAVVGGPLPLVFGLLALPVLVYVILEAF